MTEKYEKTTIQKQFSELKQVFDPMIKRTQLIQVAAQIHAACVASPTASGYLADSIREAANLIDAVDAFLAVHWTDEQPGPSDASDIP